MRMIATWCVLAIAACSKEARIPPDTQPLGTLGQIRASLRTVCGPTIRLGVISYAYPVARQARHDIACLRDSPEEGVAGAWTVVVTLGRDRPTATDDFNAYDPVNLDSAADDDWSVFRVELFAGVPSEVGSRQRFGPSLELGVEWYMAPFLTPEQLEKLREDLRLTPRRYLMLRMEDGTPQAWWPDLAYREPSRRR